MAEGKASFLLYSDFIHVFEALEDDEAGRLIKHILRYVNDKHPVPPDKLTKIAFEPIKQQLKRDLESWNDAIENKKSGGALGNLKRWNTDLHELVTSGSMDLNEAVRIAKDRRTSHSDVSESHRVASIAVNDNVTVNVNDTVNVKEVINTGKSKRFIPPTVEEVTTYCQERKIKIDPQRFIDHYTANGWHAGKVKMKDWKATIRNWERNNFNSSNGTSIPKLIIKQTHANTGDNTDWEAEANRIYGK